MVAAFVLIAGVVLVLAIAAVVFSILRMPSILSCLVPIAPWLVMVGTFSLILTEVLLLFGNKDDRRSAIRDLRYLVPTLGVSAVLWYVTQKLLW